MDFFAEDFNWFFEKYLKMTENKLKNDRKKSKKILLFDILTVEKQDLQLCDIFKLDFRFGVGFSVFTHCFEVVKSVRLAEKDGKLFAIRRFVYISDGGRAYPFTFKVEEA